MVGNREALPAGDCEALPAGARTSDFSQGKNVNLLLGMSDGIPGDCAALPAGSREALSYGRSRSMPCYNFEQMIILSYN
ncbi:MAG: hypothetical protein KGR70_16425 [Cyanobacteria bacterium REEB494]|nr:hypothetical protein [Cyanobacteria bacterium REEB494]